MNRLSSALIAMVIVEAKDCKFPGLDGKYWDNFCGSNKSDNNCQVQTSELDQEIQTYYQKRSTAIHAFDNYGKLMLNREIAFTKHELPNVSVASMVHALEDFHQQEFDVTLYKKTELTTEQQMKAAPLFTSVLDQRLETEK